jgi:hypothetical protein
VSRTPRNSSPRTSSSTAPARTSPVATNHWVVPPSPRPRRGAYAQSGCGSGPGPPRARRRGSCRPPRPSRARGAPTDGRRGSGRTARAVRCAASCSAPSGVRCPFFATSTTTMSLHLIPSRGPARPVRTTRRCAAMRRSVLRSVRQHPDSPTASPAIPASPLVATEPPCPSASPR